MAWTACFGASAAETTLLTGWIRQKMHHTVMNPFAGCQINVIHNMTYNLLYLAHRVHLPIAHELLQCRLHPVASHRDESHFVCLAQVVCSDGLRSLEVRSTLQNDVQ